MTLLSSTWAQDLVQIRVMVKVDRFIIPMVFRVRFVVSSMNKVEGMVEFFPQ